MGSKKMTDLEVLETSGVDHPAHMHEGWAVLKSATPNQASAAFAVLGTNRRMMTASSKAAPVAPGASLTAEQLSEAVQKAIDSKLQPILDTIAEGWKSLREYAESTDTEIPSAETAPADPAAAALAAPGAVMAAEDVMKSLPEGVRDIIEKSQAEVRKAHERAEEAEKVAKAERSIRLDNEYVAKTRSQFPNLALSDEVAKQLRAVGEADAELHKSLEAMLVAANAQLDGAPLMKELGINGHDSGSNAMSEVTKQAQALVDSGDAPSLTVAKGIVFERQPQLADAVRKGE
jgi:hypothetical protein